MADNVFQGEMDPELAALLGTADSPPPDFNAIFGTEEAGKKPADKTHEVDLSVSGFPKVTKRLEDNPHKFFEDPAYYKNALLNEGDIAQRLHAILQKYLNAKDPKDRSVYRQQLQKPYWDFLLGVARKSPGQLPPSKKFLLRFGILHPTFLKPDIKEFFGKVIVEDVHKQPVYYVDEWLKLVGTSQIRPSTTDEVKVARNNNQAKLQQQVEKAMGKLDGAKILLKAKNQERIDYEKILKERVETVLEHFPLEEIEGVDACYSDSQRRTCSDIQEVIKTLIRIDHEHELSLKEYQRSEAELTSLQSKIDEAGEGTTVDLGAIDTEFETIRQMAKMTIGRQGNHYPILTSEYFHCGPNDVATRENVIQTLARIESIDAEAFCRTHKNRLNRIVPYVILIPTYGDLGFCWEPFDRFNRATSRARVVIPMYPKNLYIAILTAVADLRWQVAKEKASMYWMEEGLTGNYYQWFQAQKLKGDIKEYFIQDYVMWMTKESEGIQKLDKEVRGSFWRFMPFTREVKEKLRNRSFVYQELYQRDINRQMSDGY